MFNSAVHVAVDTDELNRKHIKNMINKAKEKGHYVCEISVHRISRIIYRELKSSGYVLNVDEESNSIKICWDVFM